ncbi:hypothetical protein [Pseudomonas chlororaphis]|uniref:hypothetical protein n=1 Tax=Pseudomonas chlororaphis TaxID=587753 RepID=UPI000F572DEE|nr:hypothetical protein [Pseudomonas chlororaphis]
MPFLAGHISTVISPTAATNYVDEMNTVVPGSHYALTMGIDLQSTPGNISQTTGEVYLDLSNGYDFTVNFGGSSEEENRIGQKFKELYEKASPDMKKYVLGFLDSGGNYALTPVLFLIRTQPAPMGSLNGGAILLFVQTQCSADGSGGNLPGASFPYLIPNDTYADGVPQYSGAVLIASKALCNVIGSHYMETLIPPVSFQVDCISSDTPCSLTVTNGQYSSHQRVDYRLETPAPYGPIREHVWSGYHNDWGDYYEDIYLVCHSLKIFAKSQKLQLEWTDRNSQRGCRETIVPIPGPDSISYGIGKFNFSWVGNSSSKTVLDTENNVRFITEQHYSTTSVVHDPWLNDTPSYNNANAQLGDIVKNSVSKFLTMDLPQISLFTLANLLFPENDTLQLSSANLPGDLACFGQLDPERSSFRITPLQTVVGANQTQQFRIDSSDYESETVGWSVQAATEGLAGTIDANGLYRAPPASSGISVAHQDIITARIGSGATLKQASAVVAVVDQGITVNPTFKVYATPGVTLRATTQGTTVTWTKLSGDGSLQSDAPDGKEVLFVAPSPLTQPLQTAVIEAHDINSGARCRTTILMIKGTLSLRVEPVFIPPLGPLGQIPLTMKDPDGNEIPAEMFVWTVLSGNGTVSQGLYTAPADIQDTCAVISVALSAYPAYYGFAVIPLHR